MFTLIGILALLFQNPVTTPAQQPAGQQQPATLPAADEKPPSMAELAGAANIPPGVLDAALAIKKEPKVFTVGAGWNSRTRIWATIEGPLNRIERQAFEAEKKYEKFSPTPDDLADSVVVSVNPTAPSIVAGSWVYPEVPHKVVIRPKGAQEVIQPLWFKTFQVEWSNAMGGKFQTQGVQAVFKLSAIPPGEFDIIVPTDGREARWTVKAEERQKIR